MAHEPAKSYQECLKKLQALIIADSFDSKFAPLENAKTPKCLFPIANVPNLHYVIEFLVMNEVKEIIIASSMHRIRIQQFLKAQAYKGVKIDVKGIKADSESFGDALREVADLQVLRDDFIVVRGDIITNINI